MDIISDQKIEVVAEQQSKENELEIEERKKGEGSKFALSSQPVLK